MSKKRKKQKNNTKSKLPGYIEVDTKTYTNDEIKELLRKGWSGVTAMDVYYLYQQEWTTTMFCEEFGVKPAQVMNRLRQTAPNTRSLNLDF